MIKKLGLLALVLCLLLVTSAPVLAQAQSELTVLDSSVEANFPAQLTFSLSARSQVDITDIRLCYTIDSVSFAQVISEAYVEFVSGTTVSVSWTLSTVVVGGLPPGAVVEYWWKITDASGQTLATSPELVRFDDDRYSWRGLAQGMVELYWYEGDDDFAMELMDTAQQALERLAADTGAYLERPVALYIYANSTDLKGAMIYPHEWTGGVAFPRQGRMAIGISSLNISWGKKAIAHELTHLVIHQMTLNPYSSLPLWLDEGLAVYNEGELESAYAKALEAAIDDGSFISVQSLCSPFPSDTAGALLSYAESYSLVAFLIAEYGQAEMLELLKTFKQGSDYDDALEKVYGFDMDGLDSLWREYVTQQY